MSSAFDEPAKMNLLNAFACNERSNRSRTNEIGRHTAKWKTEYFERIGVYRLQAIDTCYSNECIHISLTRTDELKNASIVSTKPTNSIPNVFLRVARTERMFIDLSVSTLISWFSRVCGDGQALFVITPVRVLSIQIFNWTISHRRDLPSVAHR